LFVEGTARLYDVIPPTDMPDDGTDAPQRNNGTTEQRNPIPFAGGIVPCGSSYWLGRIKTPNQLGERLNNSLGNVGSNPARDRPNDHNE
jgi:hypothetical protein